MKLIGQKSVDAVVAAASILFVFAFFKGGGVLRRVFFLSKGDYESYVMRHLSPAWGIIAVGENYLEVYLMSHHHPFILSIEFPA